MPATNKDIWTIPTAIPTVVPLILHTNGTITFKSPLVGCVLHHRDFVSSEDLRHMNDVDRSTIEHHFLMHGGHLDRDGNLTNERINNGTSV